MITEQDKIETLNRILTSNTFSKSTTANVLLKYLVERSIKDEDITAADIGHDIFGSKYDQEKSEATVRVNIYHLRKKLKKYFDEEGKNDAIIVEIERGQYKVSFKKRTSSKASKMKIACFTFISVVAIIVIFFLLVKNNNKDKIWSGLLNNKHQTTLFLSPVYGYVGPGPTGESVFHRDSKINSDQQLQKMLDSLNLSDELYKPEKPYYITFEDGATLKHFSRIFSDHDADFVVQRATNFLMSDTKNQNIIYLSPMRYHTTFSDVFNGFAKNSDLVEISYENVLFRYSKNNSKPDSIFSVNSDAKSYEYAIAAKFKGSNNTSHIMFFADHGLGLSAMAEFFTNKDSIHSFSKKYLQHTEEFIAIFYVSGKDRTNLDLKLVLFDDNQ